ncbi:protein Wnt-10a isoform X2 [Phymastichus coffea]|uniref:protein Wnt-10a isoform X2 n=1 Tax=Phymastichus coffea TaxID=108790 RepID=UPI00273C8C60|nr:protein Wnt-10a isoform X2 [Phymastichus coffea]
MQSPRPTTRRAIAPAPTATSAGLTRSFGAQLLLALLLAPLLLDQRRVSCLMSNSVEDWVSGSAVVCNGIPGLTKEQRELCHRSPDVTVAAIKGIEMAIAECQHQFQWHRWNCSSLTPSSVTQHSSVILQRGYRETGFVYAISSAGVAHSVSRACSMGRLISCGCDPSSYTSRTTGQVGNGKSPPSAQLASRDGGSATQWKWGGCSHNLEFGVEFSKQFLDGREVAGDIQSTVNLHNNQAGRNAVSNNMQIRCKCHGMSGSCELKTCWKVVPDFRIVGRTLKNRFRNAVAVTQSNFGNVTPLNRVRGASRRRGHGRQERKQVAQLLRARSTHGHRRHLRATLQPAERRRRRLRLVVLWPWLQCRQAEEAGALRVQVPLVLLRAVPELHRRGVDHRVQVNDRAALRFPPSKLLCPSISSALLLWCEFRPREWTLSAPFVYFIYIILKTSCLFSLTTLSIPFPPYAEVIYCGRVSLLRGRVCARASERTSELRVKNKLFSRQFIPHMKRHSGNERTHSHQVRTHT